MAIKNRLRAIESRVAMRQCECQTEKREIVTVHPDEEEPPAQICPKCGKEKLMILVKYIERSLSEAI